jgi:hypothetical protein
MWIVQVDKSSAGVIIFLLKEDGTTWKFESKGQAKRILLQNNIDLDSVEIIKETESNEQKRTKEA